MTDFNPAKIRDQLAEHLCRDSDANGAANRMIQLLVLCVVVAAAMWTHGGIRELREWNDLCESELIEFQRLTEKAARSPSRDASRVAGEFSLCIAKQTWHSGLERVRLRVLQTPSGLRVRFTRTIPMTGEGSVR